MRNLEPIIEVRNLTKVFFSRGRRITAVDDVSFDVFDGDFRNDWPEWGW